MFSAHNTPFLYGATLPSGPSFFRAEFTNGLQLCQDAHGGWGPGDDFGSVRKALGAAWIYERGYPRSMQKPRCPADPNKVVSFKTAGFSRRRTDLRFRRPARPRSSFGLAFFFFLFFSHILFALATPPLVCSARRCSGHASLSVFLHTLSVTVKSDVADSSQLLWSHLV